MAVPFDQTYWTTPGRIEERPRPKFTWSINLRPEQLRNGLRHLESPTFYTDFGKYHMTLDTAPMDGGECPECGETFHEVVWIYEMKKVVPYEKESYVEDRSGVKRFSFEVKKGAEGVPVSICSHSFNLFYHEYIALARVRDSSRLDIFVTIELPPPDFDRRCVVPVIPIRRDQCEYFNELWWSGKRADVHFDVKGQIFRAHREILAASSSKFRDDFRGVPASPDCPIKVIVNDVEANEFQAFLRCIYTGQIDNIDMWCVPLLMLAHRFKVGCVERMCVKFTNAVKDNSNPDGVDSVFQREFDNMKTLIAVDLEKARQCNAMMNKTEEEEGKDDPSVREENMKNSRLGQEESSASTSLAPQYIIPLENREGAASLPAAPQYIIPLENREGASLPGAPQYIIPLENQEGAASLPGAPGDPPPPYKSPSKTSLPAAAGPASPPSRDSPASKIDVRLDVVPRDGARSSPPPPDDSSSATVEVGERAPPVASTSGSTSATTVAAAPSQPPTLSPPPQPRPRPRPQTRSSRPAVPTNDLLPASKTHLNNWIEKQGQTVRTSGSRASSASRLSTASATSLPSTPTSLPSNNSNRDSNKTADSAAPLPPPISPVPLTYLKLDVSALLANRKFPVPPRSASPAPSVPAEGSCSVDSLEKSPEPEAQSTSSVPDVKGASFAERVKSVSQTRRPEGLEQRLLSTAAADVAPVNALPVVEDPTSDAAAAAPAAARATAAATAATSSTKTTKKKGKKKRGKKYNKPPSSGATPSLDDSKVEPVDDGKVEPVDDDKVEPVDDGKVETVDDGKDGEKKTTDNDEHEAWMRRIREKYEEKKKDLLKNTIKNLQEKCMKRDKALVPNENMVIYFDPDFMALMKEAEEINRKDTQAESETAHGTNEPGGHAQVLNSLLSQILVEHSDELKDIEEKSNEKEDSPEADDSKVTEAPENEENANQDEDSHEIDDRNAVEDSASLTVSEKNDAPESEEESYEIYNSANFLLDQLAAAFKEDASLTVEDSKETRVPENDGRGIEEARTSFIVFEETEASEKAYHIGGSDAIAVAVRNFFTGVEKLKTSKNGEKSKETKKSHESSTSSAIAKEAEDPEDKEKSNEKEDADKTDDCGIDEARTSFRDSEETKATEETDNIEVSDTTEDASEMRSVVRGTLSSEISEKSETSENEEKSKEAKQCHKSNDCNGAENSTSSTVSKEAEAPEEEEKANEKEDSDESDDCKLELEDSLDSSRTVSVTEESIKTSEEANVIDIVDKLQDAVKIDFSEIAVRYEVSKEFEASNETDEQVEKSDDVTISQKSEDSENTDDSLESKNLEEANGSMSKENSKKTEASNEIKDAAENEDSNEIEESVPAEDPQEYKDTNEVEEPVLVEDPIKRAYEEYINYLNKYDPFYRYVEKWDSR